MMLLRRRCEIIAIAAVLCAVCLANNARAQTLTSPAHTGVEVVPIGEDVYGFLRHLSVRGLIDGYSEAQLPLSAYEIRGLLESVSTSELSGSETAQLRKYLAQYGEEPLPAATVFASDSASDFFSDAFFTDTDKYLYRWFDRASHSDLYVHGIASLEERVSPKDHESVTLGTIGGAFNGTLSGHVGYYMRTTNGEKFGSDSLVLEDPVLAKNRNLLYYSRTFFDFTSAELAYNDDWFTAKIAREALGIGGSYQGDNVILSPNVPYYDFVSIGAHVGAVRYQAVVASLLDDTVANGAFAFIPIKFLTMHDLTFGVGRDVELGFTDMVIYSRRLDLAYLNPFSFLKSVEHSLNDRDNGLLGIHARWRVTPGIEVRGQGLMDDVVASNIGTGYWGNKFAWQFGAMWANAFGLENVDWMVEASRVEPYTYSHFSGDNRFSTTQTVLGAQIGPNSISYWSGLRWVPSAKVSLVGTAEYIEHGENIYDSVGDLVYNAGGDYLVSETKVTQAMNTHILDGRLVHEWSFTATLEYEPWRDVVVYGTAATTNVDYPTSGITTPGVDLRGIMIPSTGDLRSTATMSLGIRMMF